MPASGVVWLERILDGLLFLTTVAAVAVGFWKAAPDWASLLALVAFFILFVWRWYIDSDCNGYLKSNWFDLLLVVLLASPALRLLMAFKIVGLMPALRIGALIRSNREKILRLILVSQDSFPAAMTLIFGVLFVFGISSYMFEHGHNPSFGQVSDGLWWAFVTLTTVGYGDIVPITSAGRIVGVFTMIFGIAVYSLMIANITFFVEQQGQKRLQKENELKASNGGEI